MAEEPVTTITIYGADQEILKQTDADGNVLDPSMLFDLSTWTTAANAVEDFASSIGISMDYAQEEFEQSILDTILNPMGSPEFVTNDAGDVLQGMDITGSMFAAEIRGTFEAVYDSDSDDWDLSSGTITSIEVYPVTFDVDGSPVVGEELVTSNTSLDVAWSDVAAVIMAGGDYEEGEHSPVTGVSYDVATNTFTISGDNFNALGSDGTNLLGSGFTVNEDYIILDLDGDGVDDYDWIDLEVNPYESMVVTDNNTITAVVIDSEAGALETAVGDAESAQLIFYGGAITNNETGAHTGPTEIPLNLVVTGVEET